MNYNYENARKRIDSLLDAGLSEKNGQIVNFSEFKRDDIWEGWVGCIAVDVINYKKLIDRQKPRELLRVMQLLAFELTTMVEELTGGVNGGLYIKTTYSGDQIIFLFNSSTKANVTKMLDITIYLNTARKMLSKMINKKFGFEIDYGIGASISQGSIIFKYGKFRNDNTDISVIGECVYEACMLSEVAGRPMNYYSSKFKPVMVTTLMHSNAEESWKNANPNTFTQTTNANKTYYQSDYVYTAFNNYVENNI